MSEIKIGFRVVLYSGETKTGWFPIRESYEQAVKDIENENEKSNEYNMDHFTHAQVEKVYYRH